MPEGGIRFRATPCHLNFSGKEGNETTPRVASRTQFRVTLEARAALQVPAQA